MRGRILLLILVLALVAPVALGAPRRHHVLVELELGPGITKLIQSRGLGSDAVQIQTVALNLKGMIYFHEQGSLFLEAGAGPAKPLKMKLLLERGDYLVEFLLFDPAGDRFEFKALPVSLTGNSPAEIAFKLSVADLSQENFKDSRKMLVLNPKRLYRAFDDHMIWFRLRELSRRDPERWPDLFREIKLQSLRLQSSPFVQNMTERSLLPDSQPIPWIVAEKIFEIAILADNIDFLTDRLAAGTALAPSERGRILAQIEKDAGRILTSASSVDMKDLFNTRVDKDKLRDSVARLDRNGVTALLVELSEELGRAVQNCFFPGERTIEMGRLSLSNPLLVSRKIELVGAQARRSAGS